MGLNKSKILGGLFTLTNGLAALILGAQLVRKDSFLQNALGIFLLITGGQILLWLIGIRVELFGTVENLTQDLAFARVLRRHKNATIVQEPRDPDAVADNSLLSADPWKGFVQSKARHSLMSSGFGMMMCAALGIIGLFQTQLFVSLLPRPSNIDIRNHIAACKSVQDARRASFRNTTGMESPRGIIDISGFDIRQMQILKDATQSLVSDEQLQRELINSFGTSFRDIDVMIVPGWQLNSADSSELMGITVEGWLISRHADGESNIAAFTLRERPNQIPVTFDGNPRVVLNVSAFQSPDILRFTLFHELLHAMNVPGFVPSRLAFAQDDLTYLPEYRNFINKSGIGFWHEALIWGVAVVTPWLIFFVFGLYVLKLRRRLGKASR
jgi:hypothetical protein